MPVKRNLSSAGTMYVEKEIVNANTSKALRCSDSVYRSKKHIIQ